MFKQYDQIEIINGKLCLWKDGAGRSYPCPFAFPHPCGTWCPHFGEVSHANGDPRLDYMLTLGCCGTLILAKKYRVTILDETKGSVGVGEPVNQYKEIPKPAGKSRIIFCPEAFSFASLVRAFKQCKAKKKWKDQER